MKKLLRNKDKAVVIYESRTGSTARIARAIARGLECRAISVKKAEEIAPGTYPLVVAGCPVHMFGPTWRILKMIRQNKPEYLGLFCTFGLKGAHRSIRIMGEASKKSDVLGTFEEVGEWTLCPNTKDKPYPEDIQRANDFGRFLAEELYRRTHE